MSVLTVLRYPDSRLRIKAKPVAQVDEAIQKLLADMLETMYHDKGVGLAATQVDQHLRVVVMDMSREQTAPLMLVNPTIIASEGEQEQEEGCLSLPTCYANVLRAERVTVRYLNGNGVWEEDTLEDMAAVCVQHEIDHLNGKLFVDYLSPLKRRRIAAKLRKMAREEAQD